MNIEEVNCLTRSDSIIRWICSFQLNNSISMVILRDPIYLCAIDERSRWKKLNWIRQSEQRDNYYWPRLTFKVAGTNPRCRPKKGG